MISPQMEEYLEAIGRLEERGEPATTSALAAECHVAAPTATEMLRRLVELGLVAHEPRREATLTDAGRQIASSVLRRHRLWERFLHDVLGLRWDKLHEQACELEHATSPDLEKWLATATADSHTCPHGHAIPGEDPGHEQGALMQLTDVKPEQTGRVVSVDKEEGALLRQLDALGIHPGHVVHVVAASEQGQPLAVAIGGRRTLVPREQAAHVVVQLLSPEEALAAEAQGTPLSELAPGETGVLQGYNGGRGIMGRCLALGFTPGTEVQMVRNTGQGPVIALVRDTRVALGRGEADKIMLSRGRDRDAGSR